MDRSPQIELARRLWLAWYSVRLGVSYATAERRMAGHDTPPAWVELAERVDAAVAQAIADKLGLAVAAPATRVLQ